MTESVKQSMGSKQQAATVNETQGKEKGKGRMGMIGNERGCNQKPNNINNQRNDLSQTSFFFQFSLGYPFFKSSFHDLYSIA